MTKFIFVHIPKIGGSSIVSSLKDYYGDSLLHMDRNMVPKNCSEYDIIFGHFRYTDYPKDIPKVTWFRKPVERLISHYQQLLTNFRLEKRRIIVFPGKTLKLHTEIPRDINIVDFAELVGNLLVEYTDGGNLSDFDYIGFNETMENSYQTMLKKYDLPSLKLEYKRVSKIKYYPTLSEYRKISEILRDDIKLYEYTLNEF